MPGSEPGANRRGRQPYACNVWWRTRVTLPACDACKAMLRSCAIPAKFGPATCDSNAEAAVSETARYPEIPVSWGRNYGAIARFRSGTIAFTARDADHYTTIAIVVGQGGLDTIQRPPASDAGTLPAELHPACWLPHLESHQGPIAYRAIALDAELYGSVEALQPSHATPDRCFADWPRLRNRNAPSVAFSSREENWLREVDSNHYQAH